jgi:hypothetical protein
MAEAEFSHYRLVAIGGPGWSTCSLNIEYWDSDEELIGSHGALLVGFCATWKDVAQEVRNGLKKLGLDADPLQHVSPMVDLS